MRRICKVLMVTGLGLTAWTGVAVAGEPASKAAAGKSRDARLEAKLDADLQKDSRLADKVDAQARAGKVTLTGTVETEADKVRAGQLAGTSGARAVDNKIAVTAPAAAAATPEPALGESRALSDPQRKDPLVGAMPAEQTGSREIRLRTMGMEDPKVKKQLQQQKAASRPEQAAQPPSR